ncbi:hypothetical protein C8Q80DRAFT_1269311 [Daedaleopsis nitida]|nr:hypothetical protein C8Q80DRAFT_1269311 [Daedaleopsis nitida]
MPTGYKVASPRTSPRLWKSMCPLHYRQSDPTANLKFPSHTFVQSTNCENTYPPLKLAVLSQSTSYIICFLICLLGTLSTVGLSSGHPTPNGHTRAVETLHPTALPQWDFIEQVIDDKHRFQYPLLPSDRYWLIRALLTRFPVLLREDPLHANLLLEKAYHYYLRTRTRFPDLHLHILRALSISCSTTASGIFSDILFWILQQSFRTDAAILRIFLQVILECQDDVSASSKESLLRVLAQRLQEPVPREPSHEHIAIDDSIPSASVLVSALERATFDTRGDENPHSARTGEPISRWALEVAHRVFTVPGSVETVDLLWNCLILLALARVHSSTGRAQNPNPSQDPVQQAAIVEWQTVCVLAAIENLFRSRVAQAEHFSESVLHDLSHVIRKVWKDWIAVDPNIAPPRSLLITRAICISFLKLGRLVKDRALVDACRQYCVSASLWSPETEAGLQSLAVEQLYSSLVCGTFFERALVDLMIYIMDPRIIRGTVDGSIMRYAQTDPEQALELVELATNRNVPPANEVKAAVGVALAQRGISAYLDRYIVNVRLPHEVRAKVASAHLKMYIRYGRGFISPSQLATFAENIFLIVVQLEPNERKRLFSRFESSVHLLIRHQQSPAVVSVVEKFGQQYPTLFSEMFYTRLLYSLLHHRQFQFARSVLTRVLPAHPAQAQRWTSFVISRLWRAGAKRLASRLSRRTGDTSLSLFLKIYRGVHNREHTTTDLTATKVNDPIAWRTTVHTLAREGRFEAAFQFFNAVYARATPEVRTSMGNTILSECLWRRRSSNARRLTYAVETYRRLRETCGFAPDHVTVNILVKAHLRATTQVDAQMTRRLFDQLVCSGYPAATSAGAGRGSPAASSLLSPHAASSVAARAVDRPPFGTTPGPVERVVIRQIEIPRVDGPLRYERHVRPLYKMFVKAFYDRKDVVAARRVIGIMKALEEHGWGSSAWEKRVGRQRRDARIEGQGGS